MKMSRLFSLLQELSNQQGRNYWGGGGGMGAVISPKNSKKRGPTCVEGGPGRLELRNVELRKQNVPKLFSNIIFYVRGGLKFSISDLFRPQFSRKFLNIYIKEFSRKLRSKKV